METTATTQPQASAKTRACYELIARQFAEMAELSAKDDVLGVKAPSVSEWSVGQHLDHMANAADGMLKLMMMMLSSKPQANDPPPKPKMIVRVLMGMRYIPRGRGKAPEVTLPKSKSPDEIRKNIERVRGYVGMLEPRLAQIETHPALAPHPALGQFNACQWLRFLDIHNHHHLKIIRDIRRKA